MDYLNVWHWCFLLLNSLTFYFSSRFLRRSLNVKVALGDNGKNDHHDYFIKHGYIRTHAFLSNLLNSCVNSLIISSIFTTSAVWRSCTVLRSNTARRDKQHHNRTTLIILFLWLWETKVVTDIEVWLIALHWVKAGIKTVHPLSAWPNSLRRNMFAIPLFYYYYI